MSKCHIVENLMHWLIFYHAHLRKLFARLIILNHSNYSHYRTSKHREKSDEHNMFLVSYSSFVIILLRKRELVALLFYVNFVRDVVSVLYASSSLPHDAVG